MPSTKPGNSSTPRQPCATIGRKRISSCPQRCCPLQSGTWIWLSFAEPASSGTRSEEHTSELQSRLHLVCRLMLYRTLRGSKAHKPEHKLQLTLESSHITSQTKHD